VTGVRRDRVRSELIGVDVGGTFTDIVAVDPHGGTVRIHKVSSTPSNQAQGVLKGIMELCGSCGRAERIAHGTTVATNTLLEGDGALVALVTTAGFRDTIEIGRCRRNVPDTMFNTKFVRPAPLIPRRLRFEVRERLRPSGDALVPLEEEDVISAATHIRDSGATAVAICFLHSYVNDVHERRAKEIMQPLLPNVLICTSSEILPELREFERMSTTVVNAYIAPRMQVYVRTLVEDLKAKGYAGDLYTMASHGGVMSSATTMTYPIRTILSGPASGVQGGVFVGHAAKLRNLITYDMGGTSTDVCLVEELSPLVTTQSLFNGIPISTPQIEIHTVGAGGGSVAWIDIDGALKVGPRSAGAVPGPACYGLGGNEFTITDANLLLGRLSNALLGGALQLRMAEARKALAELGAAMKWKASPESLAEGVIRLAVTTMAGAIRKISIERGYDAREFTLMAMGGAGPMHAAEVAQELGIGEVVVPPWPGNISALGLLTGDLRHDYVRTVLRTLALFNIDELEAIFTEMERAGVATLREEGVPRDRVSITRLADLRFVGQAFELMLPVPSPLTLDSLTANFRELYRRRYGHDHDEAVEVVNLRVACSGSSPKPSLPPMRAKSGAKRDQPTRSIFFAGAWHTAGVLARETLVARQSVPGPIILEEFGTTTIVPPDWGLTAHETGTLFIRRVAKKESRDGVA
jgi:N-methylhydantoinase A